jgi:hypothetical protein
MFVSGNALNYLGCNISQLLVLEVLKLQIAVPKNKLVWLVAMYDDNLLFPCMTDIL